MTAFEALNILRQFDLAGGGAGSREAVHLVAEACRRAFLDRFAHLGDPDQQSVPIEGLLSDEYAAEVAESIALDRANPEATAGDPWRFSRAEALAGAHSGGGAGGDGWTTPINVVHAGRNVVVL